MLQTEQGRLGRARTPLLAALASIRSQLARTTGRRTTAHGVRSSRSAVGAGSSAAAIGAATLKGGWEGGVGGSEGEPSLPEAAAPASGSCERRTEASSGRRRLSGGQCRGLGEHTGRGASPSGDPGIQSLMDFRVTTWQKTWTDECLSLVENSDRPY